MSSHKKRMMELSVSHSHFEMLKQSANANLDYNNLNPKIKKQMKRDLERGLATVTIQQLTGLGYNADKQLREFNTEYNNRVLQHSLLDLPSSFNVAEAFNQFIPFPLSFRLYKEKDHLISFDDFIDFVTSQDNDETKQHSLYELMVNEKIYSFNSIDASSQINFSILNGEKYEFSSISMIRMNNEISIILTAGQQCDLEKETIKLNKEHENNLNIQRFPHRAHIHPDPGLKLRAEPLSENSNLWKSLVLIRFDVDTKTIDARYFMQDLGTSYSVITDDICTYLNNDGLFINDEAKTIYEKNKTEIDQHLALFEVCKTCLLLPEYISKFEEDIIVERHPTELFEFRQKLKNRKTISLVDPHYLISHREVYVLPARNTYSANTTGIYPPDYQIETTGFWKKLSPEDEGRDKHGMPIHGRTWVSQTLSWTEIKATSELLIAQRISTTSQKPIGANHGYIYVTRSTANDKDIYKIGLTKRTTQERLNELSRSCSGLINPDTFLREYNTLLER